MSTSDFLERYEMTEEERIILIDNFFEDIKKFKELYSTNSEVFCVTEINEE